MGKLKDITGQKFGRLTTLYKLNNITINGVTKCLSEWCEILGLKYSTIERRLKLYKWNITQALELEERK